MIYVTKGHEPELKLPMLPFPLIKFLSRKKNIKCKTIKISYVPLFLCTQNKLNNNK